MRTDINTFCAVRWTSAFLNSDAIFQIGIYEHGRKPYLRPVFLRNQNIIFSNPAEAGIHRRKLI